MAVQVYRHSDTGAPTLSGTAGDLITVLDACLVNGYGSKPAAGWSKAFNATNKASYRQGSGSNQYYLDVDDSAPGLGGGREVRIRGYETMTALATGTNAFPTVAQMANGIFVRKSTSADAVQRPWIVVADQRTMYMFILTNDSTGVYLAWMFGEYYSFKTNDPGRCMIVGRAAENSNVIGTTADCFDAQHYNFNTHTNGTHYTARDPQGTAGAIVCGKIGDIALTATNNNQGFNGNTGFTNQSDNRIYLAPVRIATFTPANTIRGRWRGFWHFCHPIATVTDGDTFAGAGDLSGKSFLIIKQLNNGGVAVMETSNTWDTN